MKKKQNRYRVDRVQRRKRILSFVVTSAGTLFAVISVLLFSAALAQSYYALLDAPWLRVEEVEINGLERLSRSEILNAMGVAKNAHILTLKMGQLTRRLESLAVLQSAEIRLDPPGRLVVDVVERKPLAILSIDGHFLLDDEGKLYARATPEEHPGLLVVGWTAGAGLKEGDVIAPQALEDVRQLVAALERTRGWLPRESVSGCTWNPEEGFVVHAGQRAMPVRLGSADLDMKLARLRMILRTLTERQWMDGVTGIDLDYGNRAYVEGQFPAFKGI